MYPPCQTIFCSAASEYSQALVRQNIIRQGGLTHFLEYTRARLVFIRVVPKSYLLRDLQEPSPLSILAVKQLWCRLST
jgi:hypothetical protein